MKAASTIGEPQPDSPMNRPIARRFTTFAAGTLLILAGCSDSVAPAPAAAKPDAGQPEALLGLNIPLIDNLLGTGDTVVVLQRATPLPSNITVTQVIGRDGGTISFPAAGLTVDVPAGAVSYPTIFTVTALAGRPVAYEFGPHGTKFAKQLTMTQDLRVTYLDQQALRYMHFHAGYFSSQTNLIDWLLRAVVSELLPATVDATNMVVRFNVSHFSGYLVAVD
jgi:hypothetical protein